MQRDNTYDTVQTVTETNIILALPYSQLSTRTVTYSPAETQRPNHNKSPSYCTYNKHSPKQQHNNNKRLQFKNII